MAAYPAPGDGNDHRQGILAEDLATLPYISIPVPAEVKGLSAAKIIFQLT
jgi:hypothetical protein